MRAVLEGINVLDFGWVIAGPLLGKYLADYGANVVKVESSRRVDVLRGSHPFKDGKPGIEVSGYYAFFNPNKYSLSLDLDNPASAGILKKLVLWADIVSENFAPGVLAKKGLDYDSLSRIKPNIIMISQSGLGQTGPYAHHVAFGQNLAGYAGLIDQTGEPAGEPLFPFAPYTDLIAPVLGVSTLVAALEYRDRTGKGLNIDLAQLEACIQFLLPNVLNYTVNGRETARVGNRSAYAAPHGVYRCRGNENWCAIAVTDQNQWEAFCKLIGSPALAKEARFATLQARKENEDDLDAIVQSWTIGHTAKGVTILLQEGGVPAGEVRRPSDLLADESLDQRGQFWEMDHREIGNFKYLGQAARLSKTPARPRSPAPCLGEHNEYVCRQLLGISDEEFTRLFSQGVFN